MRVTVQEKHSNTVPLSDLAVGQMGVLEGNTHLGSYNGCVVLRVWGNRVVCLDKPCTTWCPLDGMTLRVRPLPPGTIVTLETDI